MNTEQERMDQKDRELCAHCGASEKEHTLRIVTENGYNTEPDKQGLCPGQLEDIDTFEPV